MIRLEDVHIQVDDDAMTASVGIHNPKAPKGQLSVHALSVLEARIFQAIIAELLAAKAQLDVKEVAHERQVKAPRKAKSRV